MHSPEGDTFIYPKTYDRLLLSTYVGVNFRFFHLEKTTLYDMIIRLGYL
jgi:hypothetical protein